jgi:divalent metal cation (Fe/Co/Zn/Cd) transporter
MLLLACAKRSTGRRLNNHVLQIEAQVTLIDACLAIAVAVLIGVAMINWLG